MCATYTLLCYIIHPRIPVIIYTEHTSACLSGNKETYCKLIESGLMLLLSTSYEYYNLKYTGVLVYNTICDSYGCKLNTRCELLGVNNFCCSMKTNRNSKNKSRDRKLCLSLEDIHTSTGGTSPPNKITSSIRQTESPTTKKAEREI